VPITLLLSPQIQYGKAFSTLKRAVVPTEKTTLGTFAGAIFATNAKRGNVATFITSPFCNSRTAVFLVVSQIVTLLTETLWASTFEK
jgi:hypothetical protein